MINSYYKTLRNFTLILRANSNEQKTHQTKCTPYGSLQIGEFFPLQENEIKISFFNRINYKYPNIY